jgi:hypothetical protein
MSRIRGRIIRPSSLAERRLMLSLGLGTTLRVSRSENPFSVARKLKRLAHNQSADADYLRRLAQKKTVTPPAFPDSRSDGEQAA